MKTNRHAFAAGLLTGAFALSLGLTSARAQINYLGGNGDVIFGVAPYGAPVPGTPTFIADNFDGLNDILSSPGGTYQTASPVVANNLFSIGPIGLPAFGTQTGGANGFGAFGSGSILNVGTGAAFALADSGPAGGTASYGITSWHANFNSPGGYNGSFGTYLSIGGFLPAVGSSAVAALTTTLTSINPASPFFGGLTLPPLILAAGLVAPATYSYVALGGTGAAILANGAGAYTGLAIDSLNLNIPAGDAFTATSTLTIYADPASIDNIAPDLSLLPGLSLPGEIIADDTPEPSTLALGAIGAGLAFFAARRRC